MPTQSEVFTPEEIREIEVVKTKITEKLKTFKFPTEIARLLRKSVLTGGVSASLFHNEEPNDWDIYLLDNADILEFERLVPSIIDSVEDVNPKYFVDTKVEGKLVTARATTFKNGVQIITMNTASNREAFDYIHCMPYFDLSKMLYHISRNQYNSIKNKILVKNPAGVIPVTHRTQKFIDRGWKLS
jgi:hypothetical protein